jgi:membrane-bound serine protease (ClpP class)
MTIAPWPAIGDGLRCRGLGSAALRPNILRVGIATGDRNLTVSAPRPIAWTIALTMGALLLWGAAARAATDGIALVVEIDGAIGPATAKLVDNALTAGADRDARLVVLEIDTPGGLSESMRDIIRRILNSPVPVAAYVAPSGARAASAGTYIVYASHVAAMAPGTNLGAATPVQVGGGLPLPGGESPYPAPGDTDKDNADRSSDATSGDAMSHKIVNDAIAYIRSLAELRGRNAEWAEKAVREAASLPAKEAVEEDVVDFIATSVPDLLAKADGRTVTVGEKTVTLATKDLSVERFEPSWQVELLSVLTDPNVAFILLIVGIYGLIFEFATPGMFGPGVVGAISLLLGAYALSLLPLDFAGLGLLLLGLAFMVAEAFTPTFGVLGLGGVIAFILGAVFLLDSDSPAFRLSWWVVGTVAAVSAILLIVLLGYVWRTRRRPATTGESEMIGRRATVTTWQGAEGEVHIRGENWHARGDRSFAPGDPVVVRGIDGLTLAVAPFNPNDKGEH